MKLADLLHKTPWWALLLGGVLVFLGLAAFVTPYHIIDYRNEGETPEARAAIKREIDNTFAENAIDIARGVIINMRAATTDPERREELGQALQDLNEARKELREAGTEVMRAKREAVEASREAARSAREAIEDAKRQVQESLKSGGVENEKLNKALEESLEAAKQAELEAEATAGKSRRKSVRIGVNTDEGKPLIDVEVKEAQPGEKTGVKVLPPSAPSSPPAMPAMPSPPVPPVGFVPPGLPSPPSAPLPPEVREQIRRNVSGDMYRIGIGAALMMILIPLFVLGVVSKFLIDRSRASQRMADLKRKEAEYHRMGQQVTEAKLQALQAQVEPHFLYNTLASVQALTEVDPQQANAMTGHLIQYLRNALPKMREGVSTVGQEIELVRAYLNILQMRMGKRLSFEIAVPAELHAMAFPPLMLPSLVENSIKHGLEPQREGGNVLITARSEGGVLSVAVADTGRGFGETIGAGVGLANIRERLAALYGDKGKLTLESNTPAGVVATIEVPTDARAAAAAPAANGTTPGATPGAAPAMAAEPRSVAARTLAVMGTAERAWRKALSFTFVALVVVSAVLAGLAIVGALTGLMPVQIGDEPITGAGGAIVGAAGIALAFLVVVLALAIVIAVVYGMGFLMVGLAIFIPVVVLISLAPVLAPFVLLGLLLWWVFRNKKKEDAAKAAQAATPLK